MRVVLHHGLYPAILHRHGPSSILRMVEIGGIVHVTQIIDVKETGSGLIFVSVCQSDARSSVRMNLGLFQETSGYGRNDSRGMHNAHDADSKPIERTLGYLVLVGLCSLERYCTSDAVVRD